MTAAAASVPLIEALGIRKKFGSLTANDIERFELLRGEIHALLGENGAGKSTLSKILYGYYRPDAGEIRFNGHKVAIASPADARALGIGMVFQSFTLLPAFSVFENIALFLNDLPFLLDHNEIRRRIKGFAARFGFSIKLDVRAAQLSAGEQQQVEILKQLLAGASVLILDEPTKVLTPQESEGLFRSMAALRASGYAIVFISHKLPEVLACADRITVMRHGRISGQLAAREATEAKLLELMFETAPQSGSQSKGEVAKSTDGRVILELRGVFTPARRDGAALRDLSLTLRAREILGIAGISGNGQRELSDLILGVMKPSRGMKLMWGEDAGAWSIAETRARGVASITDDPSTFSSVASLTVRENLVLGAGKQYRGRFSIQWAKLDSDMKAAFARFGLPRPSFGAKAGVLSGGNLQRLVLTRELARDPSLIVALYPTRGLDVQSANAVRDLLLEMKATGAAVIVVSEELEELFLLSSRIVVLNNGRFTAEFGPSDYKAEVIGPRMVRMSEAAHAA